MSSLTKAEEDLKVRARALAEAEIAPRTAKSTRPRSILGPRRAADQGRIHRHDDSERVRRTGADLFDAVLVIEEMARVCGVTGRIVVESNMGAIGAILKYGSEKQKKMATEIVLAGDKPAICITEPGAGSAANEMTTTAVKKGDRYIINGKKHWITGGGVSRLHLVFARVMEDGQSQGIAGFIAVRDETPGLSIPRREPTLGLRGIPEAEIVFEDMEVADDMVVIPPEGLRRGFAGLMNAYNGQRVGAGTMALGIAQGAYEETLKYVKERHQFGRPIARVPGPAMDPRRHVDRAGSIAGAAAQSGTECRRRFPDMCEAAQAKILASETAIKVTNDALQLHGAAGYSRNLPLERMLRDARMFTIGGGTAQILRTQVAGSILGIKVPQTRDGYSRLAEAAAKQEAAE